MPLRIVLVFFVAFITLKPDAGWASKADDFAGDGYDYTVLSDDDIDLYKEIFTLQERGEWREADKKISALKDEVLLGYVKYQRLMHPKKYRASYRELREWMAYYADLPDASKVYALAKKRRTKNTSYPKRPISRKWRIAPSTSLHPVLNDDYRAKGKSRVTKIEGRVRYLVRREQATKALKEIKSHVSRGRITERQYDRMRSWIAASLYYQGYIKTATRITNEVTARNGETAVLAHWIAGLIAFRDGDMDRAFEQFSAMAAVEYQEDALRSAGAFWAARSALASGRPKAIAQNLEIGARYPFTFYGQLSLAQLGIDYEYDWQAPMLTEAGVDRLLTDHPSIKRIVALVEVGKAAEADVELRWLNGAIDSAFDYDLLALASALDLPAAQIDIALAGDAKYLEAGLYPIPPYTPKNGFEADRALLYALMRQESKFKVDATSRVGARGLMQLMPRTASYIAKDRSLRRRGGRNRLYDPEFNLSLGQDYVNHLISTSAKGSLFDMAVAYNGGPGNLRRWKRDVALDDPLLFIESIPNPESRDFVEKVLTNIWVYRARLGQESPTREKVARGELPLYEALDQISH